MSGHIKTPEDIVKFLLLVIKSSDSFKANYHEVARDAGINTAMNAQRKLKIVAESAGFALIDGAVVSLAGAGPVVPNPRKRRSKKTEDGPIVKKQKVGEIGRETNEGLATEKPNINKVEKESYGEDPSV